MPRNHTPKLTRCGTPISVSWDDAWAAHVEATELRLSRRICGARTIDGEPCTVFSAHPSGRCRYHGGHHLTGAPVANHNAFVHGLFVRRLQECGPHCPRFDRCPFAGDDVADFPATGRPICPYELSEYDLTLPDVLALGEHLHPGNDAARQQAHQIVLLQVLIGRAARAVAASNISGPEMSTFLRLSAEYRRAVQTFSTPSKSSPCQTLPAHPDTKSAHSEASTSLQGICASR